MVNHGLAGCAHARPNGARQVLLIDAETLRDFSLPPGSLKENITIEGLDFGQLQPGTRLQVGGSVLEITKECLPCRFVETVQRGLLARINGRRGQLARVIESGEIRVGDSVRAAPPG